MNQHDVTRFEKSISDSIRRLRGSDREWQIAWCRAQLEAGEGSDEWQEALRLALAMVEVPTSESA